jgi:3,2-trans-enoyl-CoA isomerase
MFTIGSLLHGIPVTALPRGRSGALLLLRNSCSAAFSSNASGQELVKTEVNEKTNVASLILNRPPVNSLSLEMFRAISSAIQTIERDYPKVQGLVLSSSKPGTLSAGLDLTELHKPDPQRLPEFWNAFQQVYLDLYGSRLACVAAIEGHAPAAGCMLTMCCDYRIMAASPENGSKGPKIGLNETKLGISAPFWLGHLMVQTIGNRQAEKSLALGTLYSAEEALIIGLVDEVVPGEEVLARAHAEATKWAAIPPLARVTSKMMTRKKLLDDLEAKRQEDTDYTCEYLQSKTVQMPLSMYFESLQKKRG